MKIKRYLFLFFLIIIVLQTKKIITNIQLSDVYYINFDPYFSLKTISEIKDYINLNLKNNKPQYIYKELSNKFPIIKSIRVQRKNADQLTISIIAFKPLYIINNNFNNNLIFSEKPNLIDINFYENDCISNLPIINLKENVSTELLSFLKEIPNYIVNLFKITWQSKNLIYLQDKSDENLILKINFINIPNQKIIEACKKIKLENYTNNKQFIADLRFLNQIIIS